MYPFTVIEPVPVIGLVPQVVKQLWVYIRANELQDPENKRKILCNDELRGLFGVDSTDIFKMNKLLSRHIWPLDKPAADGKCILNRSSSATHRIRNPSRWRLEIDWSLCRV